MSVAAPLIALRGVSKHFGRHPVLDQVDLEIPAGRILTLIGPSGCGKTTLVRIALGLLHPDGGTVTRTPGLRIGYMPQKLAIDPTLPLSVGRFLQLAERDPAKCRAALAETGIPDLWARPVRALSGGETQRMLLARALLRRPDLLVLDEPVQGVDVTGQEALYALIGDLRQRLGCAILMVSHDLHLVMAATDEVICLNG
ncbi:MAG: ATP-binding cassette domain-containing protein, partial [Porticoccaceae bacterium]